MLVHKLLPLLALGLNLLLLGAALAPDRKRHHDYVFAYLAASLAVWNLGVLGLRWTEVPATAAAWESFLHLGVIPIPALFYHYVLAFLDLPRRRRSLAAAYALAALFLVLSLTPWFLRGVTETAWGFAPAAGPAYAPFVVYFQAYLVAGLVRLLVAYPAIASSFKRNRARLVIGGVVVSLAGGLVDFLRFMLGWEWLYPIGIPCNAVFAVALGVAIVRYRLLDVRVLVRRLLLYLGTSVALAPVLFAGLWVLDQLLAVREAPGPAATTALLVRDAALLLLVFVVALPLLRKLEAGLERVMFRRQHGARDALVALGHELASLLDLGAIGRTLTEGLVRRVPVVHASLYAHDGASGRFLPLARAAADPDAAPVEEAALDERLGVWLRASRRTLAVEEATFLAGPDAAARAAVVELERRGVALVVPVLLDGGPAAVLVVGEKLSGEVFDGEEIELVEMLAGHTAIALANARLYEDLRRRMDELQRAQEQLVQSAKLAAIGELSASVAHEINNPLMVIMGTAGLLRADVAAGSRAASRLDTIVTEAGRAGKITRDLLDFARRREPHRERLSLHDLLDRAVALAETRLRRARIDVERCYDPALGLVAADRDQLTQVFLNLVANAVDAMPDGGTLTLRTEARPGAGETGQVVVSVSDTGTGIAPAALPRIFEPFYTTKPDGQGTGLGLSVSLGIVQMHGGTLEAESKPGRGTTLRVTLPAA